MALKDKLNLSKMKERIDAGMQAAQDAVSNVNVEEVAQGAKDAVASKAAKAGKALGERAKAAQDAVSNINVDEVTQGAVDAVAVKAAEAAEALESGAKSAQESIANFNMEDAVQSAKDAAAGGVNAIGKAVGDIAQKTPEEPEEDTSSIRDFIALLWCMAYADGSVSETEAVALDEISIALDESYESYASELKQECGRIIQENGKEFGYQNAVKMEAQKLIESIKPTPTDAKLICWNLLSLANSDGVDDSELDLIRFVGEKTEIDPAAFAELKNYSDAIAEIERSIEELKQSGRSYGEIEPLVSEFTQREQTIIEAAQSLITDR